MSVRFPRSLLLLACLAFLGSLTALPGADEEAPLVGLTFEEVTSRLGEPHSSVAHDNVMLCHFRARKIAFRDGVAVEVAAIDEDQVEDKQEMLERVAKEKAQVGNRLMARFEASGEIEALEPRDQLEFWLRFQVRHPEVDVTDKIAGARAEANAQSLVERRVDQEAQIARLQERIADLESEQATPADGLYGHRNFYPHPVHRHHSRHNHHHRHHEKERPAREPSIAERLLEKPPAPRTPAGSIGGHEEVFRSPGGVAPLIPHP